MTKKCLTVYDITGIQDFVFLSSKAKENIGASIYLEKLFNKLLPDCLKEVFGENKVKSDWTGAELEIITDNDIKAEIVYIGGGNAMLVFDSRASAIETTKALSRNILKDTQGTLGVAVAYIETEFKNFTKDRQTIFDLLRKNKNSLVRAVPLRPIAITHECSDGLSSAGKQDGSNYISNVSQLKREYANENKSYNDLLPDGDWSFPTEFDNLGQKEGESHIAVIHIDGNSMGRFFDDQLANIEQYDDAIKIMRDLSSKIDLLYKTVFKDMLTKCINALQDEEVRKRIKPVKEGKKQFLPIRPIILNGDDVTFVCDGRLGIQLANYFLKKLAESDLELSDTTEKLSACAGVAIVKSHFPFFRAYQLAESLCASAKKKAKILDKDNPSCWMDYHIVYGGFQLDLSTMREDMYNVPGMDKVSRTGEYKKYNLLLRPFCITNDSIDLYNWKNMEQLFEQLNKWPRSRLKELRNAFISSEENVRLVQQQNSSRDYKLPEYSMDGGDKASDNAIFVGRQTPYFEPLELLDFYISDFKL